MMKRLLLLLISGCALLVHFQVSGYDWVKLNTDPVCFGARGQAYGSFYLPSSQSFYRLAAIKLVHLYGSVTCDSGSSTSWSYWGCYIPNFRSHVNVVVTIGYRRILPAWKYIDKTNSNSKYRLWSRIPGYTGLSNTLVLSDDYDRRLSGGQELRLWYGEDLRDSTDDNNAGRTCSNVYARFV